jgi:protein NirF
MRLAPCSPPSPSASPAAPARPDALRGTGDLGVVIERAAGRVQIVEHSHHSSLGTVAGLGDLSHAHVTFSRDGRFAYVFGRDGGLTKVDLLARRIDKRIIQAGNSIGGSISQDGRLIVARTTNRRHQGLRRRHPRAARRSARRIRPGQVLQVVGLADVSGQRFVYALFEAGEIWVTDFTDPPPVTTRYPAGKQPYDGLVTPDGRYFLAGLFGEDGISLLDLWQPERGATRSSPATAAAKSCRSSRCPTCAAGRWPPGPGCPPSAATRCSSPTPAAGRRPPACRSRASRCS